MTETAQIAAGGAAGKNATVGRQRFTHARPDRSLLLGAVAVVSLCTVVVGVATREERYWAPDEGFGYALGVVGLGMMTLLLLYSLRKRWRPLRRAGRIQHWFHIHMALGLLGPTAILSHGNFQIPGSLNAKVALGCMLAVSLSGVIGRFIYTRIHYEYLGHVATLEELRSDAEREGHVLRDLVRGEPRADQVLRAFREKCIHERRTWIGRVAALLTMGWRERSAKRHVLRIWRASEKPAGSSKRAVRHAVKGQLRAIRRVGEYAAYERLFALWHALHFPFTIVLFLTAAAHVVAVHMY